MADAKLNPCKVPFPTHLGKYFIKTGKIRAKIHEIGKIKAIFGLGMTPIYGLKNGQIKSLIKSPEIISIRHHRVNVCVLGGGGGGGGGTLTFASYVGLGPAS